MTIFDKIIAKEIPADIVYEDDDVLAFRDINPVAPTHILIIPKKRIRSIADAEDDDQAVLGKLLLTGRNIAREQGFDSNGYRLVINTNDHGGQTVYHIHVHLLAGRQMTWPPG